MEPIPCDAEKSERAGRKLRDPIKVLVTGAAGRVAYPLMYMIGRGEVFGVDQPVILHMLEVPEKLMMLDGLVKELLDCALPLFSDYLPTDDIPSAFGDVSAAFLLSSVSAKKMADRTALLKANVKIFKEHGGALNQHAKKTVKVLVMASPCNTNAWVCMKYAPDIPKENFSALTRLDQNRANSLIAMKTSVCVKAINNVIIWGNSSATRLTDAYHASVHIGICSCRRVRDVVKDDYYLREELHSLVLDRSMEAKKHLPSLSTAKAACDHMHDWWMDTPPYRFVSMSVLSDNSYGVPLDIMFSFPVAIKNRQWKIVKGLPLDSFSLKRLELAANELLEEKKLALEVLEKKKF